MRAIVPSIVGVQARHSKIRAEGESQDQQARPSLPIFAPCRSTNSTHQRTQADERSSGKSLAKRQLQTEPPGSTPEAEVVIALGRPIAK